MRILSIAAIAALALGAGLAATATAAAQSDETPVPIPAHPKKIFGYQDPATGDFHALGKMHGIAPDASSSTTLTGTLEVVVTVTLKTPLPKGGAVICVSDFIASQVTQTPPADTTYDESAAVVATVAGSTATCTIKIPYAWAFPTGSGIVQHALDGSLDVEMFSAASTTVPVSGAMVRSVGQAIVSATAFPANGATTIYDVSATL